MSYPPIQRARFVGLVLAATMVTTSPVALAEPPADPPGRLDPGAGYPGRWARELDRRDKILRARRGKDPAAVLALVGMLPELEGELDPKTLESFVDGVEGDARRHAWVRAYAGYVRARLYESRGQLDRSREVLTKHGHMLDWQVIGPFDNANHAGEMIEHMPVRDPFSVEQVAFGKLPSEPLSWRAYEYEGIPRGGYVSLDDVLRPNEAVTGYATTWVHVPEDTDAVVHIGTGGPYRVWVGEAAIGEGTAERGPNLLQEAHRVQLKAGYNRVLVKVSAMSGMWGFIARISRPDGEPIAGLKLSGQAPEDGSAVGAVGAGRKVPASTEKTPISVRQALEARYRFEPDGPTPRAPARAGLDLVEFYRWTGPFDRTDETLTDLAHHVDERIKSARSAWLTSLVDREQNDSRAALEAGIKRARGRKADAPLLGRMLLELAWRDRALGLEQRYRELLEEAMAVSPDDPIIESAMADRLAEDGFGWLALSWTKDMVRRYPDSGSLTSELASRLGNQGHTRKALEVLQDLAQREGHSGAHVSLRIAAMLDLGDAAGAVALAERSVSSAPGLPEGWARLAHLQQARGNIKSAQAALGRAIMLAPHDADLHAHLGRVRARDGDKTGAIASLKRSLQLRPQQPDVRDLLAALDTERKDDLFARHALDFAKIGKKATPKAWKGKDAGMLHHRVAVRVLPNGLTERIDHRVIRIVDDRGIRSQAVQATVYDPAETSVDIRRARVRRADGSIEEIGQRRVIPLVKAGYQMYYDQRQLQVQFPGLRVGDTIEVAFVHRDVAAHNMFDEYFGDLVPLQGGNPRARVEYILEAPADKPIYFNVPVDKTERDGGKTIVYRHVQKQVAAIKPEPAMPGWTEFAKYLHASTYRNWDDVGRWYWNLVSEQLIVNDAIKKGVAEAIKDLPANASEADKVAAIYTHVVRKTRYVGLEFGINAYKPYRTTEVYARQFGDCKDKASLLKVMLGEVGIDSHLVLVRTRDNGTLPQRPASLAAFNHAITYVPSLDLFLDGTAEWSGSTELPSSDQGASVLIVEDGKGGTYREIPMSEAADNRRRVQQLVELASDGSADLQHDVTITGAGAARARVSFQSREQRNERLTALLSDAYAGVEVSNVQAPGIEDINEPAKLSAKLKVPKFARPDGAGQQFFVLGRSFSLASSLAGLEKRTHDLDLDVPSSQKFSLSYELPAGHRFARLPQDKTIDSKLGSFSLTVESTRGGAKVESELVFPRSRITPAQYSEFRDFLRRVDESLEQTFEVVPAR